MERLSFIVRSPGSFARAILIVLLGTACGADPGATVNPDDDPFGRKDAAVEMPTDGPPPFKFGDAPVLDPPDMAVPCTTNCDPVDAGPRCGDGKLEGDEQCDDGNPRPGDGCSGLCRIEPNYRCPTPGAACELTIVCGDGQIGGNEACDDKNTAPNDGCSATCTVEAGWECAKAGEPCMKSEVAARCGDGKVQQGETCDDGNAVSFDGCSGTCQREAGWSCPTPGMACARDEYCGDGRLGSNEMCDDGNNTPGDGCTGTCLLEAFFMCPTPGMACVSTIICGDGKVIGDEACDDGNKMDMDGCAADCKRVEGGFTCPRSQGVGGACIPVAMNRCGDGRLTYGEFCDDGNMNSMDGCSATCRVEAGYICETPGMACKLAEWCGDGKLSVVRGEQCDDGNGNGADGCSTQCQIEANYVCPQPGMPCVSTILCGDGRIAGTETCDDGNSAPNDGCSASCQVEDGWSCPSGAVCRPFACGDGKRVGAETCDDGNTTPNDGCSATCQLELPGPTEKDAWVCPTPGMACQRTNCGNGVVEGSEQCDFGDNDMGDGCSPFCRREPTCPAAGGACSTACGDGLLLAVDIAAGQQCDDGNTRSGDGCSSDCKIEAGYTCSAQAVQPDPLILPIVLRDFKGFDDPGGHPDFEQFNGAETGIVQSMLGANGKPLHVTGRKSRTINNDPAANGIDYFSYWYADNATYNQTFVETLSFTKLMSGAYQYNNSNFFPLTNRGWGNYKSTGKNFHFTSEVRYWFEYRGGERLDFTGDDDVWVFINKRLAVDLGGVHSAESGSVILHASNGTGAVCDLVTTNCSARRTVDLGLQIGSVYEIVVFQAERHTTQSNYRLTLSDFAGQRSTCTPVCGDGVVTSNEACDLGPGKNTGAYGTCNANCTLPARCGDGVVQTGDGEDCDDGLNRGVYGGAGKVCGAGCKWAPYCGDTRVDGANGEACDQGADNGKGYGYCSMACQLGPRCGDGAISDGEQCDDGVLVNGTVSSTCSTMCTLKCGNGMLDAGEECDDGAANNVGGYGKCQSDCHFGPRCGDGVKNGSEQCDDGKNDGSYGTCAPMCVLGPRCGDGTVQEGAGEVCDKGGANNMSAYGPNLCTNRCRPAPYCGDKAVDGSHGEVCDDGVNSGQPGSCSIDCKMAIPLASCGNGNVDANEQCDDGGNNGSAGSTCDVRCRKKCGNGFPDPGEQCDDGKNDGSYGTCKSDCTLAGWCGDGTKNGPEDCDQGQSNAANAYGPGKCTASCTTAPYCGDGRIQSGFGEQCDGTIDCSAMCKKIVIFE